MKNMHNSLAKFTLHFLKPYKFWAICFVMIAAISGFWGVINAYLLKIIINILSAQAADKSELLGELFWPALAFIFNFLVHDLCWRGLAYINYKTQAPLKNDVISYAFNYVSNHSYQFFQDNFSGRIASNISTLANNLERGLNEISMHIIRIAVLMIVSLIGMFSINQWFGYGLLVWSLSFAGISYAFSRKIADYSEQHAKSDTEVSGIIVDSMSNIQNIRLFASLDYERNYLGKSLVKMSDRFATKVMYNLKLNLLQGASLIVMQSFMLYMLIYLKQQNLVTIGDFAMILGLALDIGWNLWWLTEQIDRMNDAVGRCKNSLNVLFCPLEIQEKPRAKLLKVSKGRIVFDNVYFNYKNTESLFQNKSVIIEAGQKVGLVGHSGGGKTTFVNLILRFYEVNSGRVLIDSQDIKEVTQDSLHAAIGMIPQDPSLFHRSLMDNIRYGNLNASDDEVITAAKGANAHDFIMKLPQGYNSLVGERGIKLSGGQRQRIAIARAILKNAPILILDEATSQLDSITEHEIQESLWSLMQNKTSIVIAHRLSTLLEMDRILVFDQGKIVEDGTHKVLLAKGGIYKGLWDAQVGGFIAIE